MFKPLFVAAVAMLATPALAQATAAGERPFCSATVTDGCQQTKAQQARAMTGAQVDAREANSGGKWTPDMRGTTAAKPMKTQRGTRTRSTTTTTSATTPQ